MRNRLRLCGLTGLAMLGLTIGTASAEPALRVQVDQKGDFILLGNTLGYECAPNTPAPVVGTVGNCGTIGVNDSAPDIFWRADSPADGQAEANISITAAQARSTAVLTLPAGATVTHAYLYWAATGPSVSVDTTVTLDRAGGFSATINAIDSYLSGATYQALANITALVQANGAGAYRVSNVNVRPLANTNVSVLFGGWWMVVFYQLATDPPRNLALFDGFDLVDSGGPQNAMLSGFLVPNAGIDAKLGMIAYDGDNVTQGDQFFFYSGVPGLPLSDAQNPANNFFNGTRSYLGAPVSVVGDLPQLTGGPQSMSGIDLDVIDVTDRVVAGQTSANIQATSTGDAYYLGGFVTSIATFKPDFSTAMKTATDLNGGVVLAGDVIEYSITAANTGNDAAVNAVLTDPLPVGVTYVAGSLQVTQGPNMGAKTDMPVDDQGEYDALGRIVKVRLGTGADGLMGGTIPLGESTTVVFQVTVDAGASGTLSNQASISAAGQQGGSTQTAMTDGDGNGGGSQPTDIVVVECLTDANCSMPKPYCDTSGASNACVGCTMDAQCSVLTPTCDPVGKTCVCVASGVEACDGIDNDCDGAIDQGNPGGGVPCSSGLPGVCDAGATSCSGGAILCMPIIAAGSVPEVCDGQDNDCDGAVDQGDPGGGLPCPTGLSGVCDTGTTTCAAGAIACTPLVMPGSTAELCDGLDNNCDGAIDEGNPGSGLPCSSGLSGICDAGTTTCVAGVTACTPVVMPGSTAEVCDGLDNNCDGAVDEGNPGGGLDCLSGLPGICDAGTTSCTAGAIVCTANTTPGSKTEICDNGIDEDCNGTEDDDPSCGAGGGGGGGGSSSSTGSGGDSSSSSGSGGRDDGYYVSGGGCACSVESEQGQESRSAWVLALAAGAIAYRRRRRLPMTAGLQRR